MRVQRIRRLATAAAACVALQCGACASNLKVTKVPLAERQHGADHETGFRYYLNRPYLVVKKPILVTEMVSLVVVEPARLTNAGAAPGDVTVTFLDGPRQGQSQPLSAVHIETPGAGGTRTMTQAELERIAKALAARQSGTADDGVVPVRYQFIAERSAGERLQVGDPGAAAAAASSGAPGAFADSSGSTGDTSIDIQRVQTATDLKDQAALVGDMEIIYLPDLDEQYAIKSCNLLAKTAFGLTFRNGTELTEVQGEHDATTLALSLLQQVQNAITTAAGVEQEQIKKNAKLAQGKQTTSNAAKAEVDGAAAAIKAGNKPVWQMVERTWIKPGVYRLNKPWEIADGPNQHPTGCGLLAKLGLPLVTDVDYKPVATITK